MSGYRYLSFQKESDTSIVFVMGVQSKREQIPKKWRQRAMKSTLLKQRRLVALASVLTFTSMVFGTQLPVISSVRIRFPNGTKVTTPGMSIHIYDGVNPETTPLNIWQCIDGVCSGQLPATPSGRSLWKIRPKAPATTPYLNVSNMIGSPSYQQLTAFVLKTARFESDETTDEESPRDTVMSTFRIWDPTASKVYTSQSMQLDVYDDVAPNGVLASVMSVAGVFTIRLPGTPNKSARLVIHPPNGGAPSLVVRALYSGDVTTKTMDLVLNDSALQ